MLAYHTHNPRTTIDMEFIASKEGYYKAFALNKNIPNLELNDKTQYITFDNKDL